MLGARNCGEAEITAKGVIMNYPKIQTVFKRDPETKYKTLLEGQFSLPEFEYLAKCDWEMTEKIDGMNTHIIWNGKQVVFHGKTERAQIPSNLLSFLMDKFTTEALDRIFGDEVVHIFGEGYGAGIQSGGKYNLHQKMVLFDVKIGDWWLERDKLEGIANALGIEIVPIVGVGTLYDLVDIVKEGFNSQWGDFIAEGIVAKPAVSLNARNGDRIITKLKHNDFRRD